jgi:hypothetical protein
MTVCKCFTAVPQSFRLHFGLPEFALGFCDSLSMGIHHCHPLRQQLVAHIAAAIPPFRAVAPFRALLEPRRQRCSGGGLRRLWRDSRGICGCGSGGRLRGRIADWFWICAG